MIYPELARFPIQHTSMIFHHLRLGCEPLKIDDWLTAQLSLFFRSCTSRLCISKASKRILDGAIEGIVEGSGLPTWPHWVGDLGLALLGDHGLTLLSVVEVLLNNNNIMFLGGVVVSTGTPTPSSGSSCFGNEILLTRLSLQIILCSLSLADDTYHFCFWEM